MDVALVVLHATVTDRQGGFVSDLGQQDFEVFEDGKPRQIRVFTNEDVPVTVGLVVDHSSSMWPRLDDVTAAARAFVRSSNREDEMFVVNFNEHVSLGLPPNVRFTDSVAQLEDAIAAAPASGQTALYDAIAKALDELKAGSRDKKVLIVVSDGGDNASVLRQAQVMRLAGQSSAVIYTIGIFDDNDGEQNPDVLKRLAQVTGGEAFLINRVSEIMDISKRIARDIRHQYTIGYVPANVTPDGASHFIRVQAHAKGHARLSVRTRTGYVAGGERGPSEKSAKQ
jgi:VWFA-related protein